MQPASATNKSLSRDGVHISEISDIAEIAREGDSGAGAGSGHESSRNLGGALQSAPLLLTVEELRDRLAIAVANAGGVRALARMTTLYAGHISDMLSGRKNPGRYVANVLGFDCVERRGGMRPGAFGRAK